MTDIRPIRNEDDYTWALSEIEQYFESEPDPGTPEGDRFDLLALVIEDYERKHWAIEPADAPDVVAIRVMVSTANTPNRRRVLPCAGSAEQRPVRCEVRSDFADRRPRRLFGRRPHLLP